MFRHLAALLSCAQLGCVVGLLDMWFWADFTSPVSALIRQHDSLAMKLAPKPTSALTRETVTSLRLATLHPTRYQITGHALRGFEPPTPSAGGLNRNSGRPCATTGVEGCLADEEQCPTAWSLQSCCRRKSGPSVCCRDRCPRALAFRPPRSQTSAALA